MEIHRHYGAGGAISDAFNMEAAEWSAFVKGLGVIGDSFQLSEIDTVFIASNVDANKKKLNPDRSLVRCAVGVVGSRARGTRATSWLALPLADIAR